MPDDGNTCGGAGFEYKGFLAGRNAALQGNDDRFAEEDVGCAALKADADCCGGRL